jgi:hypothetical protein
MRIGQEFRIFGLLMIILLIGFMCSESWAQCTPPTEDSRGILTGGNYVPRSSFTVLGEGVPSGCHQDSSYVRLALDPNYHLYGYTGLWVCSGMGICQTITAVWNIECNVVVVGPAVPCDPHCG